MVVKEITEKPFLEELDEPVYSVAETLAVVGILAEQGISDRIALEGTGIRRSALRDPLARVSARQRIAVYNNATRLSNDPAIGLRVGPRLHLSSYGIYGFALLSSATLGSAIEFAFKYLKLAGPLMEKTFRLEGNLASFEASDALNLGDLMPLALEIWYSSVISMIRDTLEVDFSPSRIELSYPPPAYATRYKEVWGCDVRFNAAACRMQFESSYLDQRLVQSSELSLKMCQPVCEKLLAEFEGHASLSQKLRQWLMLSPGEIPSLETAARAFNITSRTFRRKLTAEGTSFRNVRSEVREALAVEYLSNTDLTTAEIAERIGFSDSANFRSAFKRWRKLTPTAYRSQVAHHGADKSLALSWGPRSQSSG